MSFTTDMRERVIVGVVVGVTITILLAVGTYIFSAIGILPTLFVPPRAVVAFDKKVCPDGWDPYDLADGLVIRGMNDSFVGLIQKGGEAPDYFQTQNPPPNNPIWIALKYCKKT